MRQIALAMLMAAPAWAGQQNGQSPVNAVTVIPESANPSLCAAGRGIIYEDSTSHLLQACQNGGVFQNLLGGAGGNISGTVGANQIPYANASNTLVGTSTFAYTNAGNIGIGVSAPTFPLDIGVGVLFRSSSTWTGIATPSISASGKGAIYFDSTSNTFKASQNGSGYVNLLTSNSTSTISSLTITGQGYGLNGSTGTYLNQFDSIQAISFDGATQSSGCVVIVNAGNGNNANTNWLTFTSTTSIGTTPMMAVLMDNTCAPGAVCNLAVKGLIRAQTNASQTVGQALETSGTRCQGTTTGLGANLGGIVLKSDGSTWSTIWMGQP